MVREQRSALQPVIVLQQAQQVIPPKPRLYSSHICQTLNTPQGLFCHDFSPPSVPFTNLSLTHFFFTLHFQFLRPPPLSQKLLFSLLTTSFFFSERLHLNVKDMLLSLEKIRLKEKWSALSQSYHYLAKMKTVIFSHEKQNKHTSF